jgi:hypothetical protein
MAGHTIGSFLQANPNSSHPSALERAPEFAREWFRTHPLPMLKGRLGERKLRAIARAAAKTVSTSGFAYDNTIPDYRRRRSP